MNKKKLRWAVLSVLLTIIFSFPLLVILGAAPFLPGTQPLELTNPLVPPGCSCHKEYDNPAIYEPWDTWAGSMMAQAARDPIYWATLDIAEQDVPDVGDLCIRCHSPFGWLEGRSGPPFDGSQLTGDDFEGVLCDFCHRMYEGTPPDPTYTENGQYWVSDLTEKRGPYDDVKAGHGFIYSDFHVDSTICGVCHNVSNPLINLVDDSGVDTGLSFPIERTYKEWIQSDYGDPASADYTTCSECHQPPALNKKACSLGSAPVRPEVPMHEFVGGNVWMMDLLKVEESGLGRTDNFNWTKARALDMLQTKSATMALNLPASIEEGYLMAVDVIITNLTGHKLPTGYPEGRRMWLNLTASDVGSGVFFESGAYDALTAVLTKDPQVKIYEAKPGIWPTGPTFHFVLNNYYPKDNRIPPLGFIPDIETEPKGYSYPDLGGGVLAHYDTTTYLVPVPLGVTDPVTVTATLRYQSTSKEYIEFLEAENTTTTRGTEMRVLWETYGKSAPVDMVSQAGAVPATLCSSGVPPDTFLLVDKTGFVVLDWTPEADTAFYRVYRYMTPDMSDIPTVIELYDDFYDDDVLGDGLDYYYKIETVNGCGTTM
jgi:hypothetical protein